MERKAYSAAGVKFSFWFQEFRKEIQLLRGGKTFADIKVLSEEENIFGTKTPARSQMVFSTVTKRIKALGGDFYELFADSDLSTQKLFNLTAIMVTDSMFFDFIYEVIREKMLIGSNEFSDSDIRIFFRNKQLQDEKAASFSDETLSRLGRTYKNYLLEAGLTDKGIENRIILKPILDPLFEQWLKSHGMEVVARTFAGDN